MLLVLIINYYKIIARDKNMFVIISADRMTANDVFLIMSLMT